MKIRPTNLLAVAILGSLLGLTGCASAQQPSASANPSAAYDGNTFWHELGNETEISCKWTPLRTDGGITCDWNEFLQAGQQDVSSE